jgi:N-formylglutamate amidohydrolase
MKKLILHIPHSSNNIPFYDGYLLEKKQLDDEILNLTDWYTDELFFSKDDEMIVADFSRIFCDPERFEKNEDEPMFKKGMGVLYEKTDGNLEMRKIDSELRNKIIDNYYKPHHERLNNAVKEQLEKYGKAIIIDCHSLSDQPFLRDNDQTTIRTNFSLGTDSFHTVTKLEKITKDFFESCYGEVDINKPYEGTIVPMTYYKKNQNVLSIMIEVNRKLYLNPGTNIKNENFNSVKYNISSYLELIREKFL